MKVTIEEGSAAADALWEAGSPYAGIGNSVVYRIYEQIGARRSWAIFYRCGSEGFRWGRLHLVNRVGKFTNEAGALLKYLELFSQDL